MLSTWCSEGISEDLVVKLESNKDAELTIWKGINGDGEAIYSDMKQPGIESVTETMASDRLDAAIGKLLVQKDMPIRTEQCGCVYHHLCSHQFNFFVVSGKSQFYYRQLQAR